MIRGNIEVVTPESVEGWIYTEDQKVREKLLLAFCGDRCIGSGKVNAFRSDLTGVGLGDGHLGFGFPIAASPETVGSVVVRIDGSDAVLLQKGALVSSGSLGARLLDQSTVTRQLSSLKWALKHCRIGQADFDFLRLLWSFGVYERGLLRRNEVGETTIVDAPAAVARSLLESYLGIDAEISIVPNINALNFQEQIAVASRNPGIAPVVALSSKFRGVLQIAEGSHVLGTYGTGGRSVPVVHYAVSPENLIVMDLRVTAELSLPTGRSIDMFTANPLIP